MGRPRGQAGRICQMQGDVGGAGCRQVQRVARNAFFAPAARHHVSQRLGEVAVTGKAVIGRVDRQAKTFRIARPL